MIRRLIWFILSVIVAVILFILIISFFPSRKKSVDIVNMTYIFIDDDWTEYDIFEPVHGAARDWSFLFKRFKNEWDNVDWTENFDWEYTNWDKWNVLGNKDYVWGWDNSHTVGTNPYNLPEWAIEKPLPKDCETPRWDKVKHTESILAYQQRSDVPDVCNIQRRTCNNGVLDWSFNQPSCNENVIYTSSKSANITSEWSSNVVSYTRKTVVSHNDVPKGDLIQTPQYAKNEWAEFDTKWKLKNWEKEPITDWNNNDKYWDISDYASQEQKNISYRNCKTSWWEVVNHWQFVRAYELPFGFTNASCRVELRLCVDWELKWSFEYGDCEYLDVTYEEYRSTLQSRENAENSRNTTWIKKVFR
jgi:hypothetical protein